MFKTFLNIKNKITNLLFKNINFVYLFNVLLCFSFFYRII